MKFFKHLILFLIINFGALGIGYWLMADGPQGLWYTQLHKAPWSPEDWVFGVAWTSIMILFSVYMAFLYLKRPTDKILTLFIAQFFLNVSWNYVFFNLHLIDLSLIIIMLLTLVVSAFFFTYIRDLKGKSILIIPYLIWLSIATSLNLYIYLYN